MEAAVGLAIQTRGVSVDATPPVAYSRPGRWERLEQR